MAVIADRNHDMSGIFCTTASENPKELDCSIHRTRAPLLLKASSRQPESEDGHGAGRRGGKGKSSEERTKTNTDIKSH